MTTLKNMNALLESLVVREHVREQLVEDLKDWGIDASACHFSIYAEFSSYADPNHVTATVYFVTKHGSIIRYGKIYLSDDGEVLQRDRPTLE
jgi:hypothetical protein